jgi:serine/threonine protein kinase
VSTEPRFGRKHCPRCHRVYALAERFCLDDGEPLSLNDPYHLVGRTLGDRYRVDALTGIGGMGAVYTAWHLAIDRRVAVKILQPNLAILDERMVALFEREAKTVGRLVHENIADVIDAGRTTDGIAFIVMEWLDGITLEEAVLGGRTVPLDRTANLIEQIAAALGCAHAAHIVHRDLKPANVMLIRRPDGREHVKVVDFGIAKAVTTITQSVGSIVTGTPVYASPEQLCRGAEVDARSDIYSLGVMLYRLLTGRLPFEATSLEELLREKSTTKRGRLRAIRPEVPIAVEELVERMLAPDRDDRPNSVADVSRAFAAAIARSGSVESPGHVLPDADTIEWRPAPGTAVPLERPPSDAARADDNPLLSEFDVFPTVRRWIDRHGGGGTLALIAAAAGLAAVVFSHVVGSACIHVTLHGSSPTGRTLVFGYVAEPNAGLWYLIGVPVFVIVAAHFLSLAHSTLRELAEGERLVVAGEPVGGASATLDLVRVRNRRWFRLITPLIFGLSLVAVYVPEFAAGPTPAFGWVGALHVKDYEGASIRELQTQHRIGVIPAAAQLCADADCDIRVTAVHGGHGSADLQRWRYPFAAFTIAALGLQVLFGAFAGWIAAKILFFFGVLTSALVNRRGRGLKIELDFQDGEMRFGLGALDVLHNIVLLLILTASVVFLMQRVANVTKGTSFFASAYGGASLQLVSQFGTFVVSLLPLILILVAPPAVFMILIETQVGRAIEAIERERVLLRKSSSGITPPHQKAAIERAEEHLRRRRELARRQRPWPRKNAAYRLLLVATVLTLVVVPFTIEYLTASGGLEAIATAFTRFSEILCWLM